MKVVKSVSKASALFLLSLFFLTGCDIPVLQPKGPVGRQEYHLILWSFGLMSVVVLIVFILFAVMIIKYRANRKDTTNYDPENHGSAKLEVLWTIIPIIIVILMAVPTVTSEYNLQKSPTPSVKPLTVEATSIQWKWVFKYPEQGISTVNELYIPKDRPIKLVLNSQDAMASFWVPSLGGQIYTMTGMNTHMYLQADEIGTFQGRAANFNGKKFADQTFDVVSQSSSDFNNWVQTVKSTKPALTMNEYKKLEKPSVVGKMAFSAYPKQISNDAMNAKFGGMEGMPGMSDSSESKSSDDSAKSGSKADDMSGMSMKGGN
ncbi:cytochrome aa3 quinol oxidase subunit II [Pullulanibacillus sp. KACC 23026]|uniref:cytochrome aa3 quinol oxidase subunit II n=1 Tax=Pullulanibacillus sp. KACC 23026 TaxID=3028315 RepID=UPI0023AFFC50|nr:cytochrome aa3 quinol oxidase subunit II [Pullulanibacillus sp. KACC 23026]WEG13034.1 cytochrome aa3 quinol oxidase subunit II [Pullulanibacillus sp. KACC 23026]